MVFNCFKTLTYTVLTRFILNWFMKDFLRFSNIFYKRIQFVIFSGHKGFSSKIPFSTYTLLVKYCCFAYTYFILLLCNAFTYTWSHLYLMDAYTYSHSYLVIRFYSTYTWYRLYFTYTWYALTSLIVVSTSWYAYTHSTLLLHLRPLLLHLLDTPTSLATALTSLVRHSYFTRITFTWYPLKHS